MISSISSAKTDRNYISIRKPYNFAIAVITEACVRTCCKGKGYLFNSIQNMNNFIKSQAKPDEELR